MELPKHRYCVVGVRKSGKFDVVSSHDSRIAAEREAHLVQGAFQYRSVKIMDGPLTIWPAPGPQTALKIFDGFEG